MGPDGKMVASESGFARMQSKLQAAASRRRQVRPAPSGLVGSRLEGGMLCRGGRPCRPGGALGDAAALPAGRLQERAAAVARQ